MVNSQMCVKSVTVTLATDKCQSSLNPFLVIEMEKHLKSFSKIGYFSTFLWHRWSIKIEWSDILIY